MAGDAFAPTVSDRLQGPLVSLSDAARALGYNERKLKYLIMSGVVPALKLPVKLIRLERRTIYRLDPSALDRL